MSKVGFEPQGVYLLVKIPDSYFEVKKNLIIDAATKAEFRKEYLSKGDKLEVVVTGSDVKFCAPGDTVAINSRGMMELTLEGDTEPCFIIRENEVIGKFN